MSMVNQNVQNFPVIPAPYLPGLPIDKKNGSYTLVLDLDETLVHYSNVKFYFFFIFLDTRNRRIIN